VELVFQSVFFLHLKSGYTIDEFLAGCPTVSRGLVEAYLKLAEDLVAECAVA